MDRSLLIISFTETATDPRVLRQIETFADSWDLTVVGVGEKPPGNFKFIQVPAKARSQFYKIKEALLLGIRCFEKVYWMQPCAQAALKILQKQRFDLIIANDVECVPLTCELIKDAHSPLMLDAHEFATRQWDDQLIWRIFRKPQIEYICQNYLSQVRRCTTVSPSFIDEYDKHYGVRPTIVVNAPAYSDLPVQTRNDGPIRLIHHGGANRSRRLEKMIHAFKHVEGDFQLDLMLMGQGKPYYRELQTAAHGDQRIRFVDPAPTQQIVERCHQYDVGIYLLEPANYNQQHALPNKLFEFIQARLAVVISPNPAMAHVVNEFQCGLVAEDYTEAAFTRQLQTLTHEQVNQFKQQSDIAAKELCAEKANQYWAEAAEACLEQS